MTTKRYLGLAVAFAVAIAVAFGVSACSSAPPDDPPSGLTWDDGSWDRLNWK
jgi:hypothetical protein